MHLKATQTLESPRLAIVTAAWNCERWVRRCVESIKGQTYTNFNCVLIDDASSDQTYQLALKAAGTDPRFTILQNKTRQFQLANVIQATRRATKLAEDVIVVVDGDDWLKHEDVFLKIANIYKDPAVWMTYGNYEPFKRSLRARVLGRSRKGTRRYPAAVEESGLFRYFPFYAGHLRTYRKFLFDAVRDEDLRDDDGCYYWAAGDAAVGFPMLEMSTAAHIRYVDEILYVYNNDHPLSDNRPETRDQKLLVKLKIAAKARYAPLLHAY